MKTSCFLKPNGILIKIIYCHCHRQMHIIMLKSTSEVHLAANEYAGIRMREAEGIFQGGLMAHKRGPKTQTVMPCT